MGSSSMRKAFSCVRRGLPKGVARTNEAFEVEKIRNPNIEIPAFAKATTRRQARQIRIFNSNFVENGFFILHAILAESR